MWQFITEYWAGWLCALIGGAILAAIPKIKALWDAVLALLHDRIYTECYRFMELGTSPATACATPSSPSSPCWLPSSWT